MVAGKEAEHEEAISNAFGFDPGLAENAVNTGELLVALGEETVEAMQ